MSFTFNIGGFGGYQTGGYPAWAAPPPPPPPPPTEIRFEFNGEQHRLLVADDVLQNLLRLSAEYEAQQRARQQPPKATHTPGDDIGRAISRIRNLSDTGADVSLRIAVRRAKRRHHPDTGGTADDFRRVLEVEETLKRAGLL